MNLRELTKTGTHFITETVNIPSGTHLKAEKGARLIGGILLKAKKCKNGLYECDLKEAGITPSDFSARGFGRKISPAHNGLYINGQAMSVSRYPKEGDFLKITEVGKVCEERTFGYDFQRTGLFEDGFYYKDEHIKNWKNGQKLMVQGYWTYDWSPSCEVVELLDTEKGLVKIRPPYQRFGFAVGQRFFFMNIMEEVTEPGDYCIDFEKGKIYFIPMAETDMNTAEIILSTMDKPVFNIENASDITIEGFTVEAFRGIGMRVKNSKNIKLINCEIKNIGNRAVVVDDSEDVVVSKCHVHHTGDSGIEFYCGDRITLKSGNCTVENCHIHDIALWDICYEPPIRLEGVGLIARGNIIHDCPHTAIMFYGNEILIEDNEIYRAVLNSADSGVIYTGRDFTFRGNKILGNFIHHCGNEEGIGGTMGFYNDDGISGTVMIGNVFYKVNNSIALGGGVDYVVKNNIFADCPLALSIDGRNQDTALNWRKTLSTLCDRFYNIRKNRRQSDGPSVSGAEPPYITRYPKLKKIDDYFKDNPEPFIPPEAEYCDNIFCNVNEKIRYCFSFEGGIVKMENNIDVDIAELKKYVSEYQYKVITGE